MARVSAVCSHYSVCCLYAHGFLGGAHVSVPARRPNLHLAMVFARRLPLVPVALCGGTVDALCCASTGSPAISGHLVVRQQSAVSLVRRNRSRHGVLHDSESDRSSGL